MTMRTMSQRKEEQDVALEIVSKNADSDFETVVVEKSPLRLLCVLALRFSKLSTFSLNDSTGSAAT